MYVFTCTIPLKLCYHFVVRNQAILNKSENQTSQAFGSDISQNAFIVGAENSTQGIHQDTWH